MAGWELLLNQKATSWNDLEEIISQLELPNSQSGEYPQSIYSNPEEFAQRRVSLLSAKPSAFPSSDRPRSELMFHDGVSITFILSPGPLARFTQWLLLEVPRAIEKNLCDVSVLVVYNQEVVGSRSIVAFHDCHEYLQNLLPLHYDVPFVIIGISSYMKEISIEEIGTAPNRFSTNRGSIERAIEFPREYYQAGVSILSYFGEVLKQKHPSVQAKVRIEQDGLIVRLHIESAAGDKEVVEKTLEEYGLVIAEQLPPEALFESRLQIVALEQKLELARMEVRYTHQLRDLAEAGYAGRIDQLQDEVQYLRSYIGRQLMQTDTVHGLLAQQWQSNEKLLLAHVSHAESLLQDLARQASDNRAVFDALTLLDQKLTRGVVSDDEDEVMRALAIIHQEKPTLFIKLRGVLTELSYEVGGSYIFKWLEAFASTV
jgi:hypothetical protein